MAQDTISFGTPTARVDERNSDVSCKHVEPKKLESGQLEHPDDEVIDDEEEKEYEVEKIIYAKRCRVGCPWKCVIMQLIRLSSQ